MIDTYDGYKVQKHTEKPCSSRVLRVLQSFEVDVFNNVLDQETITLSAEVRAFGMAEVLDEADEFTTTPLW